ncbi:hypothetical protein DdX_18898 [Ditylenchus destructor]|uniref:Uncharacterized protein n=1 Tax=Ditylenchus destructor TaxID=166010 RepID=A0AAD4MJE8_9BILA|nr:hypothetical protein DdX_18898 [Ditylenchus destructor]
MCHPKAYKRKPDDNEDDLSRPKKSKESLEEVLQSQIDDLKKNFRSHDASIKQLETKIEQTQRLCNKKKIRIFGIPPSEENANDVISEIAKSGLKLENFTLLQLSDIRLLNANQGTKTLLAEFVTMQDKINFMKGISNMTGYKYKGVYIKIQDEKTENEKLRDNAALLTIKLIETINPAENLLEEKEKLKQGKLGSIKSTTRGFLPFESWLKKTETVDFSSDPKAMEIKSKITNILSKLH